MVGVSPQNFATQKPYLGFLSLLETKDLQEITAWTCSLSGDAYYEERDEAGAHAKIMKSNLNATSDNRKLMG